jgi:SAM-dependent methyltransferase
MPDLEWNHANWNDIHGWEASGDEWSVAWGGARSQWYGTIFPRIHRFLPTGRVLEIAPGFGRWSQFLLTHCEEYFGVDLSKKCVEVCRRRFSSSTRSHFIENDGKSLAMIPDNCIDFAFYYDSLVHVEIDVIREYIWQLCQKLTKGGVAFIHHSNAFSEVSDRLEAQSGARAMSVSASQVKQLIEDSGGHVLIQEEVNWMGRSRTDCMTTFGMSAIVPGQSILIQNDEFLAEAELVRKYQSPYGAL